MCSDISIGQFCFLERLLLVHGHWCYRRISFMVMSSLAQNLPKFPCNGGCSLFGTWQICYFFYKNIVFGFTIFFFEAYTSFSGQPAYNDWYLSLYNVFFSSFPVIALGLFDQDVSERFCLKFPLLYQEGVENVLFSWLGIVTWVFNGVFSSACIFFFCIPAMEHQAFHKDGQVVGLETLGTILCTCVVWVVNCQMAISINHLNYIQHLFIWGSIISWCIFLLVFGAMDPYVSTTAFMVFVEACAPSVSFWLLTLFVLVSTLLSYFVYLAVQMEFFPMVPSEDTKDKF